MRAFLYWLGFTCLAVWTQFFLRGVDMLAVGLLVSLQEEESGRTFWLALVWVLMQEGMGSLAGGPVGLLYASFTGVYFLGRWLFSPKSLVFVCLLGVVLAGFRLCLVMIKNTATNTTAQARITSGKFPTAAWTAFKNLYKKP